MDQVTLNPYIFFKGNAKEAIEFYKGIFGGELTIQNYGDLPGDMPGKKEHPNWIMHAMLEGDVKLMASDTEEASSKAAKIELSLSGLDEEKLRKYFDGLAAGGKINMPLEKAPWGDTFGMLSDKYGVDWMVNITAKKD